MRFNAKYIGLFLLIENALAIRCQWIVGSYPVVNLIKALRS